MQAQRTPPIILDLDRAVIKGVGTRYLARNIVRTHDEYLQIAFRLMEPQLETGKVLLPRKLAREYIAVRRQREIKEKRGSTILDYREGDEHLFFSTPTRMTDCAEYALHVPQKRISGADFKKIRDAVLIGMTSEQLENARREVINEIYSGVAEFVSWYKKLGGIVLIATNTWKPLAEAAAKLVGVNLVVGDEPDFVEGRFTGKVEYVGEKWQAALNVYENAVKRETEVLTVSIASRAAFDRLDELTPSYIAFPIAPPHRTPSFRSRTPPIIPTQENPKFIVVDDSPHSLRKAKELGACTIAINTTRRDRSEIHAFRIAENWYRVQILVEHILPASY